MRDVALAALGDALAPGDLLVVNDASTVPASLMARHASPAGPPLEIRLAGPTVDPAVWRAVLFGAGDWRTPTEDRPPPPAVRPGDRLLAVGRPAVDDERDALPATVAAVSPRSPRLVELRFALAGGELWRRLYALGRPVQYAHLRDPLELWSVQTSYAGRPWAVEMPSAGRPLTWAALGRLGHRGVELARVTHAAGLSSTGDSALDAALPLPERYDVPPATVDAIARARDRGGRVVAVGTSVTRALESAARAVPPGAPLVAGAAETDLAIDGGHRLALVDGIVTGVHPPGESHARLLAAFAPPAILAAALDRAIALGLHGHELGDLMLFL